MASGSKSNRLPSTSNDRSSQTENDMQCSAVDPALVDLEKALADYLQDSENQCFENAFLSARGCACAALVRLPRRDRQSPSVATARRLILAILESGVLDAPVTIEDVSLANEFAHQGWTGLLAAMLITPSWQWPQAPALDKVPEWLWGDYSTWLFTPPQLFIVAGQSQSFARHMLLRMSEIGSWVQRNPGSAAVRLALESYLRACGKNSIYISYNDLPLHARLRGQLLLRSHAKIDIAADLAPFPREGRKLRVGIVSAHLAPSQASLSLLPLVQHLDSDRFELQIFVHQELRSPVEDLLVQRGAQRLVLSSETVAGRVDALRGAFIDVAVFVPQEQALGEDPVTVLCAHRIAPLQLVHDGSGQPAGLMGCDLFLTGRLSGPCEAATSSERPALLPGLGTLTINDLQSTPPENWTRAALSIPEKAFVWLCYVDQQLPSPELQEAWASALARQPDARLILLVDERMQLPMNRFGGLFGRTLLRFNVDENRATLFRCSVMTHDERQAYLALADAFFDAPSSTAPEWAIAAIEAGKLPLGAPGNPRTSALLRLLGIEPLVTATTEPFAETALRIGQDKPWREALLATAIASLPNVLAFHDAFVQSEAFGRLLERAFDECTVSRQDFTRISAPLEPTAIIDANAVLDEGRFFMDLGSSRDAAKRASALMVNNPTSTEARKLLAVAYAAQQRYIEAADLRLSVVNLEPGIALNWHEFALAARQAGRHSDACEALQTALRIEPARVDSWLLLEQICKSVGHDEMHQDVLGVLKQIAPDHPEVCKLTSPPLS